MQKLQKIRKLPLKAFKWVYILKALLRCKLTISLKLDSFSYSTIWVLWWFWGVHITWWYLSLVRDTFKQNSYNSDLILWYFDILHQFLKNVLMIQFRGCLLRMCILRLSFVLQHCLMMICMLMFSQCLPWPGGFSANVARMGDASDMLCFNVTWHFVGWRFLSTNVASGQFVAITASHISCGHHWFYLLI